MARKKKSSDACALASEAPRELDAKIIQNFQYVAELGQPRSALPELVSVHVAPMDNRPASGRLRIRGIVRISATTLIGSDAQYRIRIRYCKLGFQFTNASMDPFHTFAKAERNVNIKIEHKNSGDSEHKSDISASTLFKSAIGIIAGSAKIATNSRKKTSSKSYMNYTIKPDIVLIQDTPDGVRIGHEALGDPRTYDQCLDGNYLGDRPDEPLCIVLFPENGEDAKVEAQLRVEPTGLMVTRIGSQEIINERSPYKDDYDRIMREKLAAIRVLKEINKNNYCNEDVIAAHTITIYKKADKSV